MDRQRGGARQGPLWASIVCVLLIVGAVAAALAALQRLPASGPGYAGQGNLAVDSVLDVSYVAGLAQPQDLSYSPDGSRLAIIGVFTPCPSTSRQLSACDHGLAIIDPVTGGLMRLAPIEPLLGIQPSDGTSGSGEFVSLYGAGWTPDSTWYGIVYSVFNTSTPRIPDNLVDSGLLLVNPDKGVANIIKGDSGYFASLGDLSADHPIWDITRSTGLPPTALTPALTYNWSTTDSPHAIDPPKGPVLRMPAAANSFAPIGHPDGGLSFTVWQPGVLIGPGSLDMPGQRSAFITTFAAWSASGAHAGVFTAGVSLPTPDGALSVVSAPASTGTPHITQPDAFVSAPARDPALTSVQTHIGAYGWAQIAWSPDGSMLASITCFSRLGETVELRDTLSGALIGQQALAQDRGDPGCRDLGQAEKLGAYPHPNLALAWSPDGRQLALADSAASTITIWQIVSNRAS